jgi:hypothetical protein
MVSFATTPLKLGAPGLMDLIASDAVLDEACEWLCERRNDYMNHTRGPAAAH